jgi:DNA-3-methyladenine glycosylase II
MATGVRIVSTSDCMAEGARWLAAAEPRFAHVLERCGLPPLRRHGEGFPALLRAIVAQQVSNSAAQAIWGRIEAAGLDDPARLAEAPDDALRACGLSRQKIRYAHALAAARIDYRTLTDLPEPEIVAALTAVPGIGRWTAEIYVMFSLGRADCFAPGDLALQEAARALFGLPERPREAALRTMAAAWSPWRTVAAGMLWAYYREITRREGI